MFADWEIKVNRGVFVYFRSFDRTITMYYLTLPHGFALSSLIEPSLFVCEEPCLTGNPSQPASSKDLVSVHTYSSFTRWILNAFHPIIPSQNTPDDTILLVPQNSPVSLEEEFAHIIDWSFNSITVNVSKTIEIVFHRPSRFPSKLLPPLLPDIQRVDSIELLGIYLSHTLSPDQHINHLLSQCNQRLSFL